MYNDMLSFELEQKENPTSRKKRDMQGLQR